MQEIFNRIYAKGDIYKGSYKGLYCTPCESYWTEHQLDENGCCPDCHRPVQEVSEEAYFFKMSKYADRVLQYIESARKSSGSIRSSGRASLWHWICRCRKKFMVTAG